MRSFTCTVFMVAIWIAITCTTPTPIVWQLNKFLYKTLSGTWFNWFESNPVNIRNRLTVWVQNIWLALLNVFFYRCVVPLTRWEMKRDWILNHHEHTIPSEWRGWQWIPSYKLKLIMVDNFAIYFTPIPSTLFTNICCPTLKVFQ